MNVQLPQKTPDPAIGRILKVAVMAVGGQGGGVLTSWIEAAARSENYVCQSTSVAGVSQRTGATIYYIEMIASSDQVPVFALAPSEGDVDVLIASEMMEVGRAVLRGFVTPDRTTLIGSTHRVLAVSEKIAPGDVIANSEEVRAAAEIAAYRLILANMEVLAVDQGSVISASLFGALAGSGCLPFSRSSFENAIRRSGKGVDASLRAFNAGFDVVSNGEKKPEEVAASVIQMVGPDKFLSKWDILLTRLDQLPGPVQDMAKAGLEKVVNFQNCAYGDEYIDRLIEITSLDSDGQDWKLSVAAAKYIANAMAYDDIIRVADIKTRVTRFKHIQNEMGTDDSQLMYLTEFFHPRAEEIAGMLPAKLGKRVESNPKLMSWISRWFGKGRRLRTDTLPSFFLLHLLGGLKSYRLRTYRHTVEMAHIDNWLARSIAHIDEDYELSLELLNCQRLIKGYSDTHSRGHSKFAKVMNAVELLRDRDDAAQWIARLREAALKDPDGKALDGALQTINSFVK